MKDGVDRMVTALVARTDAKKFVDLGRTKNWFLILDSRFQIVRTLALARSEE